INDAYKTKKFDNNEIGFQACCDWIRTLTQEPLHFCMESTGKYGEAFSNFLYEKNYLISVVNPARIHSFKKSQLIRNKTDEIDARAIAFYCEISSPKLWVPVDKEYQILNTLMKRKKSLEKMLRQ